MGLFGKKEDEDNGLDVLTEVKEPFSFANFFEEHVVERAKKAKQFLEEKGILFFLLSPFQQRNRLILQLAVIVFGLLAGIVPRSMNLLDQTKERNAASEMAALIEKDTLIASGSITIRPLASSQYEKQHLLAFYIDSNGGTVPSRADRYHVSLSAARGVTDVESVVYSYEVLPVSENGRLLLVYTDNRNQNDTTGIYNLLIEVAADEVPAASKAPMEIVLSDTQETNELFNADGISLASLTEGILNDPNTPVAAAEEAFEEALDDYEMETERVANLPLHMTALPSVDALREYCTENLIYPDLTDTSTTKDIAGITEVLDNEAFMALSYTASIELAGVRYENQDTISGVSAVPVSEVPDVPVEAPAEIPAENPEVPAEAPAEAPAETPVENPEAPAEVPAEGASEPPAATVIPADPATAEGDPATSEGDPAAPADGGTENMPPEETAEPAVAGASSQEELDMVTSEITSLQSKIDAVLQKLLALNSARQTRYGTLKAYKLMLNQEIDVKAFPVSGIATMEMETGE